MCGPKEGDYRGAEDVGRLSVTPFGNRLESRLLPIGADPLVTEGAMQFPKSLAEMLTITHTHLLSMVVIFLLTGLGVALCERPSERWKRWIIAEPFAALLVSFSAMWLMRYADPHFSWLLEASSAVLAVTFYGQSYLILRELRQVEREEARV